MSDSGSIAARVQGLSLTDQTLILARLAQERAQGDTFSPAELSALFFASALPPPARVGNVLAQLKRNGYVISGARGQWRLSALGRQESQRLLSDLDLIALAAEAEASGGTILGKTLHSLVPPTLAPPGLLPTLQTFLDGHPFDRNVFGMTRFPDDDEDDPDPVNEALVAVRNVCAAHGLEFHLASDRAMSDDLWTNVTAHMWASRYGVAFFEDRRGRGINYNLTIEVGGMLVTGRRCALLKDTSIRRMPTDLVGMIYKPVNLADTDAVTATTHAWIRDDLALGECASCPPAIFER